MSFEQNLTTKKIKIERKIEDETIVQDVSIFDLPNDCVKEILLKLSVFNMINFVSVCKNLRERFYKFVKHTYTRRKDRLYNIIKIPDKMQELRNNKLSKINDLVGTNSFSISLIQELAQDEIIRKDCENPREKLLESILSQYPYRIAQIPNPSRELQLKVVKNRASYIKHITTPLPDVQLEAVKQNVRSIQHIVNPLPKVQFYAIQKDPEICVHIKKPHACVLSYLFEHVRSGRTDSKIVINYLQTHRHTILTYL